MLPVSNTWSVLKEGLAVGAFVMGATWCGRPGSSLSQNGQLRWLLAFYFKMSKLRWWGIGDLKGWSWDLNLAWTILQILPTVLCAWDSLLSCALYLLNNPWVNLDGVEVFPNHSAARKTKLLEHSRKLSFSVNFQFQGLWTKRKKKTWKTKDRLTNRGSVCLCK